MFKITPLIELFIYKFFKGKKNVVKEELPKKKLISLQGLKLIKQFEGFRTKAYLCPGNVWTIGYGSTKKEDGSPIKENDEITELEANKLLVNTMSSYEDSVNDLVKIEISQNQFDALVSFVYNIGASAFRLSTLLKMLNEGSPKEEVAKQFDRWTYAAGRSLEGLRKRREAEKNLFLKK